MTFGKKICFLLLCATMTGCVKKKLYQTELSTRQQAEAREQVLIKELNDRKTENVSLIKQVGDLNRTIGKQEGDIAQLRADIVSRTQSAGQTTQQLSEEKRRLERELSEKTAGLTVCNEQVAAIATAQKTNIAPLNTLLTALKSELKDFTSIQLEQDATTITITIPDKELFEPNGTAISKRGREVLTVLGKLLNERPGLDIDLVANTDNLLPKGNKTITDTWDWSLLRATALTRTLIADFGVNANQLSPVGRGEFYPIASNETPEGRQTNRRTLLIFRPVLPIVPSID